MQSENLKVRKQVGKPRRRWDNNDESYKKKGCDDVQWIQLAENSPVGPQREHSGSQAARHLASVQLCPMELNTAS
jgi:hypothetical protein